MKFRFYITNTFEGCVEGTNDIERAEEFSASEDFFVVDSETGEWISAGGRMPIQESESE